MSKLVIDNFIIVDVQNKLANRFKFSKGANLITSKENEAGKSSILKSIYYTLGASISTFPNGWDYKKYVFQLSCCINEEKVIIQRFDKIFIVQDKEGIKSFGNEKRFAEWFQDIMNMNMLLPVKKSENFESAYMNAVLTPFYIDQDKSWSNFYKDAIDNVNMYQEMPFVVFNYYFGLLDIEAQKLIKQKKDLEKEKIDSNKKSQQVTNIYDDYSMEKEVEFESPEEFSEFKRELQYYINVTNNLRNEIVKKTKIISKTKINLDSFMHDLEEIKKILSITNKRYKDIKFKCIYCNSNLTREQSLTRLELSDNDFEIRKRKAEIEQKIDDEEAKLKKLLEESNQLEYLFNEKNLKMKELKELDNIEKYVSWKLLKELHTLIVKYNESIEQIDGQIKKITKEILNRDKRLKEKKNDLTEKYEKLKNSVSNGLSGVSLNERKFLDFKKVTGTGTALNKTMLALYLIYSKMLSENSDIIFPFTIDSFIKNEISEENEQKMFDIVNRMFISIESQTFFSVIHKNLKFFDSNTSYIIDIENPLLNGEGYESYVPELIKDNN
ncbi:endonuclease [Aerococcaceae bacterium 50-4]